MDDHQATSPTVSVVITTYNRAGQVVEAITSVLRQTWTDYELIVVDDGSTDDTRERLKPYIERIRYMYQANRGVSSARNAGSRAARGRWLAYLDSDDVWHPTKLQRQFEAVAAMGDRYGACFTNCIYKGDPNLSSPIFEIAGFRVDEEFGGVSNPLRFIMSESFALCIQSLLVLRVAFDKTGGFDESITIAEDREFIFRLSFLTKFCYVSEALVTIDRTLGVERLTRFTSQRNERVHTWHEQLLKSMLADPRLVDPEIRSLIEAELMAVYYDWTATRLMRLDVPGSFRSLGMLREMGQTRSRILRTLITRAKAKALRLAGKHV